MIDKPDHNETDTDDKTPEIVTAPKSKGAGFALFIAFLALFFTTAGVAAGYRHWQRMNDKAKDNAAQIAQLQTALAGKTDAIALESLRQQLESTVNDLQAASGDSLQKMQQIKNQTEQYAENVTAQIEQVTRLQARMQQSAAPASAKEWRLEEVAFLLKLANQELILSSNKDSAMAALKEADQILSTGGSVNYLPVRQQITHDLAALKAYTPPDIAAISQQITSIMLELSPTAKKADSTPNADKETADQPTGEQKPKADTENAQSETGSTVDSADSAHSSVWQQYKQKALDTISDAIVVHQLDQPLATSLDNEARQSLYKLMQLRLENLRLMALQRQEKNFHQQIALIRDNINDYYPAQQATPLLEKLSTLDGSHLEPAVPDISGSLRQLEKARQTDLAGEQKP